ncbi:HCP-like protein [Patellaria atrata CBS 101060]|uniref:HCP-like protein n=1 Tax=Patellaria atrata CBS 101060 TaxID=1346257 RepID=A0A9P4SB98_9PEZI|nr:HCP-like protein [Patellaria atrata CBS 101060]
MRKSSLRLLPLFILSLFLFVTVALSQRSQPQEIIRDEVDIQQQEFPPPKGAIAVDEAAKILYKIQPTQSRHARFTKPTGLFGKSFYVAKQIFYLLFMNGPPENEILTSGKDQTYKLTQPLAKAVWLLENAASEGNPDAMFYLAEMSFYGLWSHPRDYHKAFRRYYDLAELNGNSTAQNMVGFMYATGVGEAVEQDQGLAMLYHTFAADQGDIHSQMTMAFRHHSGIATPRNCEKAVHYYKKVADKAMEYKRSGPPGGHQLVRDAIRIADEEGGVYGEGASVSSAGHNAKRGSPSSDQFADFEDVVEYLEMLARRGDIKATYALAKYYYEGPKGLKQDFQMAKLLFLEVARQVWPKDGGMRNDAGPGIEKLASKAAGWLGRMFLRGEGMKQSYEIAQTWFRRGVANGDALSQYSMGLMYMYGYGVPKDSVKAADYFKPAADQDLAAAQVNLGILFLDQGDIKTATRYFELAARNGHIEAFYYLAEISRLGVGRDKSCGMAAVYYKIVAEKAEVIVADFKYANDAYEAGDLETALIEYMMAAEQGFEYAQANVAYLLDQSRPQLSLSSIIPFAKKKTKLLGNAALALIYWTRSAKQQNIDSMVRMGDYYHEGLGTSPDQEKAAACYQLAAETLQSAQAMWNLGWMHENGIGIEQDFHLAKRFYDQALETNVEAYLPVTLALYRLRLRSWWNTITHGKVKSIQEEPSRKSRPLNEWLSAFLAADAEGWYADNDAREPMEPDDWDTLATHREGMPGGDDPYDIIDDGILDSLLILSLAAALLALVYYRQQRALAARRREEVAAGDGAAGENPPAGQENRGLFPPPGDPEFPNWVAGGVGH